MAIGVLGTPLKMGNSQKSEAARFVDASLKAGVACSFAGEDSYGNVIVKPFDGESFFGFVCAADLNRKHGTCSVLRSGFKVPLAKGAGTFVDGKPVGLSVDGEVVPASDVACKFVINGYFRKSGVTALGESSKETDAVIIDFEIGGSKVTP